MVNETEVEEARVKRKRKKEDKGVNAADDDVPRQLASLSVAQEVRGGARIEAPDQS